MAKEIVIVGTLDTKGAEYLYLKTCIEKAGGKTIVVDAGIKGDPLFTPDISHDEVARAGGSSIDELVAKGDRGLAIDTMMKGAAELVGKLFAEGRLGAMISLGGTAGTTIGTYVMRTLPVGVPKLQVSTVASGDTRPYVGAKDITMMYSVVDISGINSISRRIIANAAHAIVGMAAFEVDPAADAMEDKPLIAATMFGVTTPCVSTARAYLESLGYEVLVFHATGTGGQSMEKLVEDGFIAGVLDITTTEWADQLVGGVFNAGPNRLEAAGAKGVPQVVSLGALDMVNFGPMDTVPEPFKNRNLYKHNASVTLMRTTTSENASLGEIIASKLNAAQGPTALFIPLRGVSMIDSPGKPFYGPEEDNALFQAIRANIDSKVVELVEMDLEINDDTFALAMAKKLHAMLTASKEKEVTDR